MQFNSLCLIISLRRFEEKSQKVQGVDILKDIFLAFFPFWYQMASGIEKKLTKHLECAICLESFKEPKVLSCQHTYCKRCLERLVTIDGRGKYEVTCPECRKKTEVKKRLYITWFQHLRNIGYVVVLCFLPKAKSLCLLCNLKMRSQNSTKIMKAKRYYSIKDKITVEKLNVSLNGN